jgi:hypothetical protein
MPPIAMITRARERFGKVGARPTKQPVTLDHSACSSGDEMKRSNC